MKQTIPFSAEILNHACFCITLDRAALYEAIEREVGNADFFASLINTRPHLFSDSTLFISESETIKMLRVIRAIEAASRLPGYQDAVMSWAPEIAQQDFGPSGAFMGYDFHLTADGPRLIEVNSNAGGAFLNAQLAMAQRKCCIEAGIQVHKYSAEDFELKVMRMFQQEWNFQRKTGAPKCIAIVDDKPTQQYLYPEFLLVKRLFEKHGIDAVIADAAGLKYEAGKLLSGAQPIDLVYNRTVDFSFTQVEHNELAAAYLDGAVVVTPNPRTHALFADKRNLALLTNAPTLRAWGLTDEMVGALSGVPETLLVTADNAQHLWETRKNWFFKPTGGHGSKAVYRGAKVTKSVWAEIIKGGYVAQEFAAPSERIIKIEGEQKVRKADVRLYVYDGEVLLMVARLYQGQTTNFRTVGGGFAPVFIV